MSMFWRRRIQNSTLTKPQHFHEFFSQFSKLSRAKKSKTTIFSRVFHPKKSTIFSGKSKLNIWTKNEDFGQCANLKKKFIRLYGTISLLYQSECNSNFGKVNHRFILFLVEVIRLIIFF